MLSSTEAVISFGPMRSPVLFINMQTVVKVGQNQGRPQAWAEGGTCPLWKCCKVFMCIISYSKTLSRRIIYA